MSTLPMLLVALLAVLGVCHVSAQSLEAAATPQAAVANATVCMIWFSSPGNVEYPWSVATKLTVNYVPGTTSNTVNLTSATGMRTYSSKYGDKISRSVTLLPTSARLNNVLYLDGTAVDSKGIGYKVATVVPYPGGGTLASTSNFTVFRAPYGIVEDPSAVSDNSSVSITSTIPGFVPVTLNCPGNINCNNINTDQCVATITSSNNGLPRPTFAARAAANQPQYSYSYFITDRKYTVVTNLTLAIDTTTGFKTSALGDYYLTVTNITGTRVYSYFGTTLVSSAVTGIAQAFTRTAQLLFPFTYTQLPAAYTPNSAPYLDYGGLGFTISPASYPDGANTTTIPIPPLQSTWGVYVFAVDNDIELIETQTNVGAKPILYLQQQILNVSVSS